MSVHQQYSPAPILKQDIDSSWGEHPLHDPHAGPIHFASPPEDSPSPPGSEYSQSSGTASSNAFLPPLSNDPAGLPYPLPQTNGFARETGWKVQVSADYPGNGTDETYARLEDNIPHPGNAPFPDGLGNIWPSLVTDAQALWEGPLEELLDWFAEQLSKQVCEFFCNRCI